MVGAISATCWEAVPLVSAGGQHQVDPALPDPELDHGVVADHLGRHRQSLSVHRPRPGQVDRPVRGAQPQVQLDAPGGLRLVGPVGERGGDLSHLPLTRRVQEHVGRAARDPAILRGDGLDDHRGVAVGHALEATGEGLEVGDDRCVSGRETVRPFVRHRRAVGAQAGDERDRSPDEDPGPEDHREDDHQHPAPGASAATEPRPARIRQPAGQHDLAVGVSRVGVRAGSHLLLPSEGVVARVGCSRGVHCPSATCGSAQRRALAAAGGPRQALRGAGGRRRC